MRRRKIVAAVIISIMMGAGSIAGCSNQTASTGSGKQSETAVESVSGTVESVDEDSVLVKTEADSDSESGEEKDITVTSDTVITEEGPQAPPQMPGGDQSSDGQQQAPPQKPEGDQSSDGQQQAPPQMPGGDQSSDDQQQGAPQAKTLSLSDLEEGDSVTITLDEDGNAASITVKGQGGQGQTPGGQGGQAQAPESYSAVTSYTKDSETSKETYQSTGTDENAVLVDSGASVTLEAPTITRASEDSSGGDTSSFYGVGASLLSKDGTAYVKGGSISSDSAGGTGLFAYDQGTIYVSDTKIETSQGTSGALHVAGGGKLYAWDVTATTQGESSAAIRSDRGGGTMVVDGGEYTSNGKGSPAVYSTADITVHDADLRATGSEAVCIEGRNSLRLFDSNLTGNMPDDSQNDCSWNVILYQSMSGDSEEGNATFEMSGGKLTAENGGMFYTTNTESTFVLNNVDIDYADENDFFLRCTGNSNKRGWGSSGSNGADCNFTAISQKMEGDVIWDSISELDFYMTDNSSLTGAFVNDESDAGDGGDGYCSLYIEKGSSWTVTGDSSLTSLYNAGSIKDADGKSVTIKGTDGKIYQKGESKYTITVKEYNTKVDTSGAGQSENWADYAVKKPESLN